MPRKQQGWITFQSSEEERQILEQHCQQSQRTKTEVLRELVRGLNQQLPSLFESSIQQRTQEHSGATEIEVFSRKSEAKAMKVSARNVLKGTVKQLVTGSVNTEVTLEIAPGVEITSIITRASAEQLDLADGKEAYAVIKSSNVMIAVD
jgi:molybdopterin-binding protein